MSSKSNVAFYFFLSISLFQSGIIIAANHAMIPHHSKNPGLLSPNKVALLKPEVKLAALEKHLQSICAKENRALTKFCKLYKRTEIRNHLLEYLNNTESQQVTAPSRAIGLTSPNWLLCADGKVYQISLSRGTITPSQSATTLRLRVQLSPIRNGQTTVSIANPPQKQEDFFQPSIVQITRRTNERKNLSQALDAIQEEQQEEPVALSPRHRQRPKPTPPFLPRSRRLVPTPLLLDAT